MNTFLLPTLNAPSFVPFMFFEGKHDKIAYFGVWADAASDHRNRREALRILIEAADRCFEQDMRNCKDAQAALTYLSGSVSRSGCLRFRKALNQADPYERERAARQARKSIARAALSRTLPESD